MAAELGTKKKQKRKREENPAAADAPAAAAAAAPENEVVKKRSKQSATPGAQLAGKPKLDQPQQGEGAAAGTRASDGTATVEPAVHKKQRRCAPWRTVRLAKPDVDQKSKPMLRCTIAS